MCLEKHSPGLTGRDTSEFLLRLCHDLRSALRPIRAHTELLARNREAHPSDFAQSLGFIVDGVRGVNLLVDGLAAYSIALQIDHESFQPTPMDVMLRTVLAKLKTELSTNAAEVTCDLLPSVSGDPDRLIQVLENLVRNALHYRGEAPPRVHIGVEKQDGTWRFTVRDNGPGIEAAYLESIFQPFERLSRQPPRPGLGLAICREIVERHGGRIWAESPPGHGATFLFTLPASGP